MEGKLSFALVTLSLPGLGSRQHIGVQAVEANSGEDVIAKGAVTDALKKAATLFGVGLELYGPDYEEKPAPAPETKTPLKAAEPTGELMLLIAEFIGLARKYGYTVADKNERNTLVKNLCHQAGREAAGSPDAEDYRCASDALAKMLAAPATLPPAQESEVLDDLSDLTDPFAGLAPTTNAMKGGL